METHVFNEQKKRLEPVENVCKFCGRGYSENQDDNLFVPIYKEGERKNYSAYKSVAYEKLEIGVPRCPRCKEIQRKLNTKAIMFALVIGIVMALISYLVINSFSDGVLMPIIFALLIGIVIGCIAWGVTRSVLGRKENMISGIDAVLQYGIVRDLMAKGWTFAKPSA